MKTKTIKRDLLKKLEFATLKKVNEFAFVTVAMRSPVLNQHQGGCGLYFPVINVPIDEIEQRMKEEYTFVFREPKKDGNHVDGQPVR